ncbi:putative DNA repair protein RAD16 [Cladorrhinum sp. PSN332]|nr:putative DNA repair protein RAD16 [Cladorrhinum sp. PSN332]
MVKIKPEHDSDDDVQLISVQPVVKASAIPDKKVKLEYTPLPSAPQALQALQAPQTPQIEEKTLESIPQKRKKRQLTGDTSAKDYWARQYSSTYRQVRAGENQADGQDDATFNELNSIHHAKRQRLAEDLTRLEEEHDVFAHGTAREGTIEARSKMGSITMQAEISGKIKKAEQLKILLNDLDHNDPKAVRDYRLLEEAAMSFGHRRCTAMDGKWQLPRFDTPLYHHQLLGVRWMLARELSPHGPNGGILSDEMGLGKTVQILACMSQNRPEKIKKVRGQAKSILAEELRRTTLVIAPESLQQQWYEEIERHCSHDTVVTKWKGSDGELSQTTLSKTDIIVTNYHQIQAQWNAKRKDILEIEELRAEKGDAWKCKVRELGGWLFNIDWYRVVCDEGHAMANRNSRTSRACRYLIGKYRWVLTGTPMTNNTNEFFPYLDFLGTRFTEFKEYKISMGNMNHEDHVENLRTAHGGLTLRRTVSDTFMGKAILQIPQTHPIKVVKTDLSPLEIVRYAGMKRELDEILEEVKEAKKMKIVIPDAKEKIMKLWSHLRFYIAHPSQVDPQYHIEYISAVKEGRLPAVAPATRQYFCRACFHVLSDPMVPECGHAICSTCVDHGVKRCPTCETRIVKTRAGGLECFDQARCLPELKRPRKPGQDELGQQPRMSGKNSRKKTTGEADETAAAAAAKKGRGVAKGKGAAKGRGAARGKAAAKGKGGASKKARSAKNKGKKNAPKGKEPLGRSETHVNAEALLNHCDSEPWVPIPHSSKTRATLELVKQWQTEAPGDKIIIFVQWTPMLAILGRMLFQNGFRFLYYWGAMCTKAKLDSIRAFKDIPDIKVMLISVQCGALGLNLTVANRAIVVDHWWHKCMENQAFGRIHRIGQEKEVYTAKIIVNNTMDDKIMDFQNMKEDNIAMATSEGGPPKMRPLSQMHYLLRGVELIDEDDLADFIVEDDDYDSDASYNEREHSSLAVEDGISGDETESESESETESESELEDSGGESDE